MLTSLSLAQAEDAPQAPLSAVELKAREDKAVADAQAAINAARLPQVGDLSKYKLDAPEVKLDATAARLALAEAGGLARQVADDIERVTGCAVNGGAPVTLLLSSARPRALLMRAEALERNMLNSQTSLDNLTGALSNEIEKAKLIERVTQQQQQQQQQQAGKGGAKALFAGIALLPAIGAIGEVGVALASAMRSSYKFDGVDNKDLITTVFGNMVQGQLSMKHGTGCRVLHVDAMLSSSLDARSPLFDREQRLSASVADAFKAVERALLKAAELRKNAPQGTNDEKSPASKLRQAWLDAADALTVAATKHNGNADAVAKALLELATPDAQGDSPLDEALRGSRLRALLPADKARLYSLNLTLAGSKADVIAKNGFFSGLKVAVASHTAATWVLFDADGRLVAAGSPGASTQASKVTDGLF
ncbi:hypothetical protein ASD88_02060 [Pelomonas sp. Root662]|nr:hypothetical protein ASC81_02060 [Pelomonas sp. Root405]KRA77682.1 hypothetical protein ASD88_02060 [Pelomonas sp. Root662]